MIVPKIAVIPPAVAFLLKNNVPLKIAILPRVIQPMDVLTLQLIAMTTIYVLTIPVTLPLVDVFPPL
jgi:hypothetical protein